MHRKLAVILATGIAGHRRFTANSVDPARRVHLVEGLHMGGYQA